MTENRVLLQRLTLLSEYREHLRTLSRHSLAELQGDPILRAAAERYLQLAVECIIDVAAHVTARRGYRMPDTHRDLFRTLAEHGIIDAGFAQRLANWVGFRNILVHDYCEVDVNIVHRVLTTELQDLDEFITCFGALLPPVSPD